MSDTTRERIDREAAALPAPAPRASYSPRTLSGAVQAAAFFERRYQPSHFDGRPVPALRDASLPPTWGADIRQIVEDIGETNTPLLARSAAASGPLRAALARAHELLRWRAEDEADLAVQVEALLRSHRRPRLAGPLAIALGDALRLMRADPDRLGALRLVDTAFFDDAETLLHDLRDRPAPDLAVLRDRRARLATLLQRRVAAIRRAADVVYRRRFPQVAREARSEETLQRAAAIARTRRRRKAAAIEQPAAPAPTPPADPALS
jgi:hypothetical protein